MSLSENEVKMSLNDFETNEFILIFPLFSFDLGRNRNWYIQATCATSGDGLYEGLDWLSNQLKNANR